ncbi:hypothetical protein ACIA74_40415 [Streptomyces sp. NPDC051658]
MGDNDALAVQGAAAELDVLAAGLLVGVGAVVVRSVHLSLR